MVIYSKRNYLDIKREKIQKSIISSMYCILLDWRFLVMLWNLCLPSFFRLRCSASRQRHLLFPQCLSKTTSHWCLFWPHGWWRNAIWSWEVLYWVTREGLLHTLVSLTACHDVTISYCSHSSAQGAVWSGRELGVIANIWYPVSLSVIH